MCGSQNNFCLNVLQEYCFLQIHYCNLRFFTPPPPSTKLLSLSNLNKPQELSYLIQAILAIPGTFTFTCLKIYWLRVVVKRCTQSDIGCRPLLRYQSISANIQSHNLTSRTCCPGTAAAIILLVVCITRLDGAATL